MSRNGFSIIEMIVVVGLISIVVAIAVLEFGAFQGKSVVERYTKELYSDVQNARMRAAFTKNRQGVVFGTKQVAFLQFTSAADVNGEPAPTTITKNLPLAFTLSPGWTQPTATRIDFDLRGVMDVPSSEAVKVICFTTNANAAYDALIITPALTSMGKVIDRGSACAATNVTQK